MVSPLLSTMSFTAAHPSTSLLVFAETPGGGAGAHGSDPARQPKPSRAVGGPYLMLGAVLLGAGIGYLLDRPYLTTPRWTAGLGLFGIAVGLYHAVREASR